MSTGRKRILLLIPTLTAGGAERVYTTLLHHLDRQTFEPHLALLQAKGEYLPDVPADVVIHDLKASRSRYALPALVRLVWRLRPHAVMSTLPQANAVLALVKPLLPRKTRIVLRQSAIATATLEDETHPRLWHLLYRRLYRRADKIVCLSDAMVEDLAVRFRLPRAKIARVYNPVDAERIERHAAAQGTPYSGAGPHLVAAGRLSAEKGFDILLAALPAVRERFPQVHLTILGQGPLLRKLEEQARVLRLTETVCFAGFQANPWPYFRHAALMVLPSRYEGLPNVLLEALVLGTPVVATDCPGAVREMQALFPGIELVSPEDPRALALAIVAACDGNRPHPPVPADTFQKFDLQNIVNQYSDLLLGEAQRTS
ncbi:MAG TPA: glycosyltransferase [Gemmataceae bacterium]|nr:glycosyltransferase [Gemmataceae bacterium]